MPTPEGWTEVPLGEAGEWLSGGTPSKDNALLWQGAIPWVSPKDMKRARIGDAQDYVAHAAIANGTRLVPPNTLLMVTRGMILAHTFPVALTTRDVTFNQDIKALRPSSAFAPEFLLQWLQSAEAEFLRLVDVANHGTKRLPTELLFAVSVPVPPLSEQRKIGAILSSVDETIEKTEAVIAQLQVVKKAMMQELLTRGMPGRHTRFKQTEIGEIPEGWDEVSLSELAVLITKGTTPTTLGLAYVDAGVPFVRVENITEDGGLNLERIKFVSREAHEAMARSRIRPGDVLFSIAGALGRTAVVPMSLPEANTNQAVALIRLRDVNEGGYLEWALNGPRVKSQVALQRTALAQANLNLMQVGQLRFPWPPRGEREEIKALLQSVNARLHVERCVRSKQVAAKSALSAALLHGEVRVSPSDPT